MGVSNINDKVIKLIKLSQNNSNVNEAAAAYAQAQRLITKHNLDEALLTDPNQVTSDSFVKEALFQGKRKSAWKTRIALATAKSNNCFLWTARVAGQAFACMAAGTKADVDMCKYMFDSVVNQIEVMCKKYMTAQNMGRQGAKTIANSFKIGAAVTVETSLLSAKEEVEEEYKGTHALMVVQGKLSQAEAWVRSENKLTKKKQMRSRIAETAFSHGLHAGQKVTIRKAIQ
jgi:hypothetical protein